MGKSLGLTWRTSSRPRCIARSSRHRWQAPNRQPGARASPSQVREDVRPISAPYDKPGTFGVIPFRKKCAAASAAQSETSNQRLVTADARPLEIVQQTSPLADHDEQPAPRMEVLLMAPQVIGEIADALAQDRHLDLRRSCVTLLGGILNDERLLALGGDGHRFTPSAIEAPRRLETAVFDLGQSDHRSVVPSADNRALVEPVQMRPY